LGSNPFLGARTPNSLLTVLQFPVVAVTRHSHYTYSTNIREKRPTHITTDTLSASRTTPYSSLDP
jgi:hypothetical protein